MSGQLDPTPGGDHPFPPVNQWGFTQHAPFKAVYPSNHRSVYLMTQRLQRHPFLTLFDGADTNASTGERMATTTPTQALFLMNDPFVHEQSAALAKRVLAVSADDGARLKWLYQIAYTRDPHDDELSQAAEFLKRYSDTLESAKMPAEQRAEIAWSAYCRVIMTSNEFLYVD